MRSWCECRSERRRRGRRRAASSARPQQLGGVARELVGGPRAFERRTTCLDLLRPVHLQSVPVRVVVVDRLLQLRQCLFVLVRRHVRGRRSRSGGAGLEATTYHSAGLPLPLVKPLNVSLLTLRAYSCSGSSTTGRTNVFGFSHFGWPRSSGTRRPLRRWTARPGSSAGRTQCGSPSQTGRHRCPPRPERS